MTKCPWIKCPKDILSKYDKMPNGIKCPKDIMPKETKCPKGQNALQDKMSSKWTKCTSKINFLEFNTF